MSDRAPYSRVYWSVMHDEKFDGIRDDCRAMGAWLTLLLQADMSWPAPAYIPRPIPKSALVALANARLIELLSGHRYRIVGLDSERERRRAAATRDPDGTRRGPKRDPVADQAKPSTSKAETSQANARATDPADSYWSLTGKYPADKTLSWIDEMATRFGTEAVTRAMAQAFTGDRTVATLLGRTQDILRSESRELDRREREDEQRRLREKRAVPRQEEPWRIEQRKAYLERYGPDAA